MGMLTQAGARLTQRAEDAEVIVVNTTSFIDGAQQESVNTIFEMARYQASRARSWWAVCLGVGFRDGSGRTFPKLTQ